MVSVTDDSALDDGKGNMLQYFELVKCHFDASFRQVVAARQAAPKAAPPLGRMDRPVRQVGLGLGPVAGHP